VSGIVLDAGFFHWRVWIIAGPSFLIDRRALANSRCAPLRRARLVLSGLALAIDREARFVSRGGRSALADIQAVSAVATNLE